LALMPNKSNITEVLRNKVSKPNAAKIVADKFGSIFFILI